MEMTELLEKQAAKTAPQSADKYSHERMKGIHSLKARKLASSIHKTLASASSAKWMPNVFENSRGKPKFKCWYACV